MVDGCAEGGKGVRWGAGELELEKELNKCLLAHSVATLKHNVQHH